MKLLNNYRAARRLLRSNDVMKEQEFYVIKHDNN